MKPFTDEQKSKKTVYTNRSESITTSDFNEYSTSEHFYHSGVQLFYPNSPQGSVIFDFFDEELDERIIFERNSEASYWDKNGNLKFASANEPRFEYDPVTLQQRGLLVESANTNAVPNSVDFSTGWSFENGASLVTPVISSGDDIYSPDGETIADEVVFDGTFNGQVRIDLGSSLLDPNQEYAFSIWIRKIFGDLSSGSNQINIFGDVVSANETSINDIGSEWERIYATATTSGSVSIVNFQIRCDEEASFQIWGAQVEKGSEPTSFIKTEGSAETRESDDVFVTNLGFLNNTEGSFLISSFYENEDGYVPTFSISDNTIGNKIESAFFDNNIRLTFTENAESTLLTTPLSNTNKEFKKVAFSYNINDEAVAQNENVELITTSVGGVDWATIIHIGANYNGDNKINGHLQKVVYFDYELSQEQLENMTYNA